MSDVSHTVIGKFDGDYGTHCNSCPSIATFKITLRNTSFRLCESCSYELFEQMDFRYRRSKLATLTALLKEAGEALEPFEVMYNNTSDSPNRLFSQALADILKPAAEIRKKIQEVMG